MTTYQAVEAFKIGFECDQHTGIHLNADLYPVQIVDDDGNEVDHATRIFFAQLGEISCWLEYCPKRMLCDTCWELGASRETLLGAAHLRLSRDALPLHPEKFQ